MRIFVSIAAYRDPELLPTIHNCLVTACFPERLRFGICWQHGPEDSIAPYDRDSRFRVMDVDWRDSRGACWARAECMKLWDGEEYFLQIDSHHRFVAGWDTILLDQLKATGSPKPILSAYVAHYDPAAPAPINGEPFRLDFDYFNADGIALFRARRFGTTDAKDRPTRARFVSGHFLFAPSSFLTDVPYDPDLYFHGEEITLAVRAFTHGYDLFHPCEHIIWHRYDRVGRPSHWEDHVPANNVEQSAARRDRESRRKVMSLLDAPWIGQYGLGTVRTLADYMAYAGISFEHRLVQDYTRQGGEPPNPPCADDWPLRIEMRPLSILLPHAAVPTAAISDPHRWDVALLNDRGERLFERSLRRNELSRLVWDDGQNYVLPIEIDPGIDPARCIVNPVSLNVGPLGDIEARFA